MSKRFITIDRSTPFLLPPSIQDWLQDDHLARFIVEVIERLDLSAIESQYDNSGSEAYPPAMLLALLFYGYCTGIFSSRKLEKATYDSVAFRYICANRHPDHDTINAFRSRFLPALKELFVKILLIAREVGLLKVGRVAIDGSKVLANASKHKALSFEYACKLEKQLREEVAELLKKAETADQANQPDGTNIPEEIARREKRLANITEAIAEINRRAEERYEEEKKEYERKCAERKKKEEETGKKAKGKAPQPPKSGPLAKDQVNLTDEESRIMPSKGGFEQAYNAQAGVDMESLLIITHHVSQKPNDAKELEPALEQLKKLPAELGKVEAAVADNGFCSDENVKACESREIVPYLAVAREEHNQPLSARIEEPAIAPPDATPKQKMAQRLKTAEGKKIYAKRKSTIETVFGIIKSAMGFRGFSLRGVEKVEGEWNLVCMAFNLKRIHSLHRQKMAFKGGIVPSSA